MGILNWFAETLRTYPEIAIFLTLAIGYYFGKFTFRGIGLGAVTATLIAGVIIGQLGIKISQPLKATVFLMFLFAVGYAVGPQFVRGVAKDGMPQALFSAVQCLLCLVGTYAIVKFAGYNFGYAAGLYSGSQTISAAMGLSTDAINRLGLPADQAKALLDGMPVAYAVTYMFGTMGSAIVIAVLGPKLLGINLKAACQDYEEKQGGKKELGGAGTAWHRWETRAFRVQPGGRTDGLPALEAEALFPQRVFVQRIRRNGVVAEATADTVLRAGDVVAVAGAREALVNVIGERARLVAVSGSREPIGNLASGVAIEVDDPELLSVPIEGLDVYVTNKEVDGKTLTEIAAMPGARGVFLRKIVRGAVATSIPILPNTKIFRGDILTIVGRTQDTSAAIKMLGVPDRATDVADVAFIGAGIAVGALIGALVWKVAGVPLDALNRGRGAHLRNYLRLDTLSASEVRPHPDIHSLVHELRRSQHLHRHRRYLGRPGLREWLKDTGYRPVPVGSSGNDCASCDWHVRRQVHFPFPRCSYTWHRFRRAYHHSFARPGLRPGGKPGSRAGIHRNVRRGQHAAYDLGHGAHHVSFIMIF